MLRFIITIGIVLMSQFGGIFVVLAWLGDVIALGTDARRKILERALRPSPKKR
jgi:hypothetical protein